MILSRYRSRKDVLHGAVLRDYLETELPSVQFTNQNTSEMSSQLEVAMETLINVFHTYSAREGDKFKLSRRELKDLLQNELGEYLEVRDNLSSYGGYMVVGSS
ncbi:unnamed protein product [Ranitomeya imitator]|uniref:S100/CaBP-9k-type calcium binding subdomain domain-containing protein n=1 Tax=Ranitomeya imitator TaxID=111125 RepID=A0ABN9LYE4_9NEOB|nr:unnamed protein product [Ranitomeya imitator]